MTREYNRRRAEIRVLDCQETTPEQVGLPGARTLARLKRRVRRQGRKTTETVCRIRRLTLEPLAARGLLELKRGYGILESRRPHALDVTLAEDRRRVRHPKAAFAPGLFRRVVVSFAPAWLEQCRKANPRRRATTRKFQKRFLRRDGGPERLHAIIFA